MRLWFIPKEIRVFSVTKIKNRFHINEKFIKKVGDAPQKIVQDKNVMYTFVIILFF